MWRAATPARGTIVEAWLAGRGLDLSAFAEGDGIDRLRFHPSAPTSTWREGDFPEKHWLRAPAMLSPIMDGTGATRAVHVTYLSPDGQRKADLPPHRDGKERDTRKMYGSVARRAVWLAGSPQADLRARPLVVGEGIETVWAYVQAKGEQVHAAAALSLDNLQGGIIRRSLREGSSWPLWNIRADLGRSPFLVDGAGEVIVLVDADMRPLRDQIVQRTRNGKHERADLGRGARAAICATAAVQHWRHAGANPVRSERPPMGMDFNDMVRA